MPVNNDAFQPVEGVRYNADHSAVLCERCDCEIERGTDFAVRLTCPEAGIIEPIGPYCREHMETLKVCCGCHRPFFGESEITYLGDGEYFCNSCKESIVTCEQCDKRTSEESLVVAPNGKKMCGSCYAKKYRECTCCGEVKTVARSYTLHTALNEAKYPTILGNGAVCDKCFKLKALSVEPVPITECKSCGKMHGLLDSDYCKGCLDSMPTCQKCGKKHHQINDMKVDGRYMDLCPSCRLKAEPCTSCGSNSFGLKPVDSIFGSVVRVCRECASKVQCPKCLIFVHKLTDSGTCSHCNNALSSTCECGSSTGTQVGVSSCRECDEDQANIRGYSTRFQPLQFHYTSKDLKSGDNLFMGFELELGHDEEDGTREHLKKIYRDGKLPINYMMAKSDGSIEVPGWEWVSAPQTLNYYNKKKKDGSIALLFDGMFDDESCGVHIHVSRTAIRNKMHEYKLVSFVDNNEKLIDEISGRCYTSYQRKVEKKPSALILQGGNSGRYQRVNLRNTATIEFRMYASTTSEYKLSVYMENAHSMVLYTKDASGMGIRSYKEYVAFVTKNHKRYPNLHKFLTSPARKFNK